MFKMEYAVEFKEAAVKLQQRAEAGDFSKAGNWRCGICFMLGDCGSYHSYEIMNRLLGHLDLGPVHKFTEDRQLFLEFLAYTLTADDIYEICVHKWEE